MNISFANIDRVMLIGGSWITAALCKSLLKREIETSLITSERHYEEVADGQGRTLKEVVEAIGMDHHVASDINDDKYLRCRLTDGTLAIATGAAWVFSRDTVAMFNGRLLDFMGIPLPKYRGGAHYTWQILSNNKEGACNIQVIEGGLDTFHKGKILKTKEYIFPDTARIPSDYFEFAIGVELQFLNEFIDEVCNGGSFYQMSLDESGASYYPPLNTLTHGWIDWSWNVEEVDRFICAFDDPYVGSSTYMEGERVFFETMPDNNNGR